MFSSTKRFDDQSTSERDSISVVRFSLHEQGSVFSCSSRSDEQYSNESFLITWRWQNELPAAVWFQIGQMLHGVRYSWFLNSLYIYNYGLRSNYYTLHFLSNLLKKKNWITEEQSKMQICKLYNFIVWKLIYSRRLHTIFLKKFWSGRSYGEKINFDETSITQGTCHLNICRYLPW